MNLGVTWKRGKGGWTRKQRRNLLKRKRGSGFSGLEEDGGEMRDEEEVRLL